MWVLWFRSDDSGLWVQGSGCGFCDRLECAWGLGERVEGLGFSVQCLRFSDRLKGAWGLGEMG